MKRALVLACGNSQRGDDGVALQIVNHLREDPCAPAAQFHSHRQWTPELAEPISQADIVIFVDAAIGPSPGSIGCRRLQPAPGASLASTHHTPPEYLLQLAQEIYGSYPVCAYLVTVAGFAFELGEPLSEPVRRAIPRLEERIKALLSGVTMREDAPTVSSD